MAPRVASAQPLSVSVHELEHTIGEGLATRQTQDAVAVVDQHGQHLHLHAVDIRARYMNDDFARRREAALDVRDFRHPRESLARIRVQFTVEPQSQRIARRIEPRSRFVQQQLPDPPRRRRGRVSPELPAEPV